MTMRTLLSALSALLLGGVAYLLATGSAQHGEMGEARVGRSDSANVKPDPLVDRRTIQDTRQELAGESPNGHALQAEATSVIVTLKLPGAATPASGTVSILASETRTPDTDPEARLLSQAVVPAEDRYAFTLPEDTASAVVTGRVNDLMPASKYATIRPIGSHASGPANAVHVELLCGEPPTEPHVFGDITFDGERVVPEGLRILLLQEPPGDALGDLHYQYGQRVARIWRSKASYTVAPLSNRARGLAISGDRVAPRYVPLEAPGLGSVRVDLDLVSAHTMRLEVVSQETLQPVGLVPLEIDLKVKGGGLYQSFPREGLTDRNGVCTIQDIPQEGFIRVSVRSKDGHVLLEEHLRGVDGDLTRVVQLPDEPGASGTLWGTVSAARLTEPNSRCFSTARTEGAPVVRIERLDDLETAKQAAAFTVETGEWSYEGEPGRYRVWLESSGIRKSDYATAELRAGAWVGPVSLAAMEDQLAPVRISNLGDCLDLELLALDSFGRRLHSESGIPRRPEVFCNLPIADGATTAILKLSLRGDATLALEAPFSSANGLTVAVPPTTHISFVGNRLPDTGLVTIYLLSGPGWSRAVFRGQLAAGTIRAPLPEGNYFYRFDPTSEAVVCGRFDVPLGGRNELVCRWEGTPVELTPGAKEVVVESLGSLSLPDLPYDLSRFRLAPTRGPSVFVDAAHATYRFD